MKITKWLVALVALMVFVGCEKSDEEKMQDAANQMQKDMEDAAGNLPSLK